MTIDTRTRQARRLRQRRVVCLLISGLGLAYTPSEAVSTEVPAPRAIAPGRIAHVSATTASPDVVCELKVAAGHDWKTLSRVRAQRTLIEWSWRVPSHAIAETWSLRVGCGSERRALKLGIRGSPRVGSARVGQLVAGRVRVRQKGRTLKSAPGEAPAGEEPEASTSPAPASTLPSGSNVFPLENESCTDWGYFKRPDIYDNRAPQDPNLGDWNAWTWAGHARLEGLRVDEEPEVGAIAVWPATPENSLGHVAYVEAINGSGSTETVSFTEMNDLSGQPQLISVDGITYTYETETDTLASLDALGVVFIHQR